MVVPLEHDHLQITLIDPGRSLDDLMPIALTNRPELASRRALVQAAEARVRREKMRPLLPSRHDQRLPEPPGMYLQAGFFGLGPNSSLNQWFGRDDVSLQLMWQLDALGIGNLARIKEQRGQESRAIIDLFRLQDMVAADVTRALAQLQSATARVIQADRALRTAIITFNGNFEGLRQTTPLRRRPVLVYRPQEAVYSLELMNVAFDEYFTTVAEYNRAQFELFHALGYPAAEIALQRPPGDVIEWTRHGRRICPRWATDRPRRPADADRPDSRRPSPSGSPTGSRTTPSSSIDRIRWLIAARRAAVPAKTFAGASGE